MRDLSTLDLRLLVVFDSLARLASVSATARTLDIPQPAVSQCLRRLRLLFDDELFLRASRRMEPTPLAASLREPIAAIVQIARDRILTTPTFVAHESRREFLIAATDFGAVTLLTLLLPSLSATAPDVRLRISPIDAGFFGDLDAGRLDLGVGINTGTPASVHSQTVFVDRYAFAMRAEHPALRARPSAALFRRARYVVVTSLAASTEDISAVLSAHVSAAQLVMHVPTYAVLPTILMRTDLIALVPSTAGRAMFSGSKIAYVNPPFAFPKINVATMWHQRSDTDPALRWLRDEIARRFEGFHR